MQHEHLTPLNSVITMSEYLVKDAENQLALKGHSEAILLTRPIKAIEFMKFLTQSYSIFNMKKSQQLPGLEPKSRWYLIKMQIIWSSAKMFEYFLKSQISLQKAKIKKNLVSFVSLRSLCKELTYDPSEMVEVQHGGINCLLQHFIKPFLITISEKDLVLKFECSDALIQAYENNDLHMPYNEFTQVLYHLVTNAIKFNSVRG